MTVGLRIAANDLASGNLVSGNLKAAGLSLWEALSFGAASNAGKVQGLYEQGQITDGEFYKGLMVTGLQSGAKVTVTLLPAAKVPGLLSGANALLTSAKIGAVYGVAEASVEVIGDRAMEDVLRISSDRTFWGDTKYVATQTAIATLGSVTFYKGAKGLLKVREAWNKSVIPDGPFFLAPNAAPAPKVVDAGIEWGKGINGQGMPWENYLATQLPSGSRLPPNFKTFDFFDEVTGMATSAKTLDTGTAAKLADPKQVYTSLKSNIDDVVNFNQARTLSGVTLDPAKIVSRELQVAIPANTTTAQWEQISKAILYAKSNGVTVKTTIVK